MTKCYFEDCKREATTFAKGRVGEYRGVHKYCEPHAEQVADMDMPEYTTSCPHCGCLFGVG